MGGTETSQANPKTATRLRAKTEIHSRYSRLYPRFIGLIPDGSPQVSKKAALNSLYVACLRKNEDVLQARLLSKHPVLFHKPHPAPITIPPPPKSRYYVGGGGGWPEFFWRGELKDCTCHVVSQGRIIPLRTSPRIYHTLRGVASTAST